ncbi:MAG: ATP-binding protein [Sulfurimonadaceae bacterium]
MISKRKKIALRLSRYLHNFSLSQIHAMATFVILLFTILFSFLLIQDEYQDYMKQLNFEYANFKAEQKRSLIHSAEQMRLMMSFELKHPSDHSGEAIRKIPGLFLEHEDSFIQLFDSSGAGVFTSHGLKEKIGDLSAVEDRSFLQLEDLEEKPQQDALAYVTKLPNGYTLITGIYTKPTEELLLERHQKQKKKIVKIVLEITTLAFILFGIIFGVNKIISAVMKRDVDTFLEFFERAAHHDQVINYRQIHLKEFRTMGHYANDMVETIMHQKIALKELNRSLKKKVEEKTEALQKNNEELADAEQFSQQLLTSQKLFLRHAVHETNTPLSVIMTNIDLFTMQHGKNRQLSKIDAAVKNIFNIYDDLSYLVKKDQVEYPRIAINFNDYLQSRLDFFEEVAEQSRLGITFVPCVGEYFVYFNETKLQRIIDNNITNAIKYTLVNETISVKTFVDHASIVFDIASRSKKIDDINKVLEPYYREDGRLEGFGLGLNLVKSICEEEDVTIEISSTEDLTRFSYRFKIMAV